jgi:hypothetical protein
MYNTNYLVPIAITRLLLLLFSCVVLLYIILTATLCLLILIFPCASDPVILLFIHSFSFIFINFCAFLSSCISKVSVIISYKILFFFQFASGTFFFKYILKHLEISTFGQPSPYTSFTFSSSIQFLYFKYNPSLYRPRWPRTLDSPCSVSSVLGL